MSISGSDALKNANLNLFIFMEHTRSNGGRLPDDIRAHACWYYARIATKHMQSVDEGAIYEGGRDHVEMLNNIARAVALQYRLESPDEFLKFMGFVKAEVRRLEGSWDIRIEKPGTKDFRKVAN